MLVSIIIPYKNEPYLNRLISEINNALTCSHEILVQTEPGLANAVICGTKKAKGNILVVLDGDGSHDPRKWLTWWQLTQSSLGLDTLMEA
jgi:glycosyltransferase involved in cell wall biosynthesis